MRIMTPTMKAILMERPGPPEVLRYADVPLPVPAPGQVLVRSHSIGVGMPEVLVRRGEYAWMPPLPAIPGIEMSGLVEKLGEGVSSLKVGQAVFVSARELSVRGGCYAEYIAADAEALYPLPDGVDLEAAAALSNYQVAWHLLHSATNGMRYGSLLVTAAAGGVGSALVQLGKHSGKRVIGVVDTDERAAFALSLGAEGAVNRRSHNVTESVLAMTEGRGVDTILDSFGGTGFTDQFERLAPFGLLVSYGFLDGPPSGDVLGVMGKRISDCLGMRIFSMHAFDKDRPRRRQATEEILRLFAAGAIRPPIWARLPLAEAGRAQALIEEGRVLGKVILKP
ncbi:MAG: zinc-dependent alcohol dehydrogenase family protein [Deltaproteobacteria bacterium]|nr:zinc-dependent alcohol dehydrogenase family protein [Deltaproteobacteria bacterium]